MKVPSGGWVPLAIGFVMIILMLTWRRGISLISETRMEEEITLESFMEQAREAEVPRVPGAGVFLTSSDEMTPISLLKLYRHMPVLHEDVIIVHFVLEGRPRVPKSERVTVTQLEDGFWQLTCPIGYLQEPYLPRLLKEAQQQGLHVKPDKVTYYIRKDLPSRVRGRRMSAWRKELFFGMLRNSRGPADLLNLPPAQVIEVGIRLNF